MFANPGKVVLAVFIGVLALVGASGFLTSKFGPAHGRGIEGWGLGGRKFGTLITWFLVGGDFYTAYTILAVPGAVYANGAMGFFALPYTILVYPFVFVTMPRLWVLCRRYDLITAPDFVKLRYGSRALSGITALTGAFSLLPYIALQLLGIESIINHLDLPLSISAVHTLSRTLSVVIVTALTYFAGLRAPAAIAFAKDIMIYIVVIGAVIVLPAHLGGYELIFRHAGARFADWGTGSVVLRSQEFSAYVTLAVGSALAAFLYPHTVTSVLASGSEGVIRRNAIFLPAYTILLGLLAMFGIAGVAMNLHPATPNDLVPELLGKVFSGPFVGFAFAAIAVAALVPASIMVISAANLIARNVYLEYINTEATSEQQLKVARRSSLGISVAAFLFVIVIPKQLTVNLQLMAGMMVLQTLPAIILGLWNSRLHEKGLIAGWATGILSASAMCYQVKFTSPLFTFELFRAHFSIYIGIVALAANIAVAFFATLVLELFGVPRKGLRAIDLDIGVPELCLEQAGSLSSSGSQLSDAGV